MITDEQVEALRLFLRGEVDKYHEILEHPEAISAQDGFGILAGSAFWVAANHRFTNPSNTQEIIRFVADFRAKYADPTKSIDPRRAEQLIRTTCGFEPAKTIDNNTKALQMPMLLELITQEQLDDAALTNFLHKARALGDQTVVANDQ